MKAFKGTMPDITQAQLAAALTWIVTQAIALGWVDSASGKHWLQIGGTVIATGWVIGDALLRGFRNIRAGMESKALK